MLALSDGDLNSLPIPVSSEKKIAAWVFARVFLSCRFPCSLGPERQGPLQCVQLIVLVGLSGLFRILLGFAEVHRCGTEPTGTEH